MTRPASDLRRAALAFLFAAGAAAAPQGAFAASMDPFADPTGLGAKSSQIELRQAFEALQADDLGRAETILRSYLASNPADAQAHEMLGAVLGRSGRPEEALKSFDDALTVNPGLASAHYNRGMMLLGMNDRDGAESAFLEAVRIDPDLLPARERLGAIYESRGDRAGAIAQYEAAAQGEAGDAPGSRVNLAALYNQTRQHDRAIALLAPWQPDRDRFPVMHRVLGDAFVGAERLGDALSEYEVSLKLAPDDWQTHVGLGVALRADGQEEAAMARFEKAAELAPEEPAPLIQIGETRAAAGDIEGAVEAMTRAAALSPAPAIIEARMAGLHRQAGEPEKAVSIFEGMIARDGASPAALAALADAQADAGQADAALATVDRMIEEFPDDPLGYAKRAFHLRGAGKLEEAQATVDAGLAKAPDAPLLLREASYIARGRGDSDAATVFAEKLMQAAPDDAANRFFLATLYDEARRDADAERQYAWLVQNVPNHWPAMNNVALVQIRRGKPNEALRSARAAARLAPGQPGGQAHPRLRPAAQRPDRGGRNAAQGSRGGAARRGRRAPPSRPGGVPQRRHRPRPLGADQGAGAGPGSGRRARGAGDSPQDVTAARRAEADAARRRAPDGALAPSGSRA